jgi:hypothetical protein
MVSIVCCCVIEGFPPNTWKCIPIKITSTAIGMMLFREWVA